MNRSAGMFQIPPLLQQQQQHQMMMMMGGSPSFWSFNSSISPPPPPPPPPHHNSSILPVSPNCHETHQLHQPESWSQLLLGGYEGEEEEAKKIELNWEEQLVAFPSTAEDVLITPKHESVYMDQQAVALPKSTWISTQPATLPPALVSPASCTGLISKNMLDLSNYHKPSLPASNAQPSADDHKCNGTAATGSVAKKPRVQGAFSAQSTFKVRKEKLGDRITALHQIVSPFGKTDTASVLLEAIGYIRFLQSQIEALSSPYLMSTGPDQNTSMPQQPPALLNESSGMRKKRGVPDEEREEEEEEEESSSNGEEAAAAKSNNSKTRDLRSRGLCLVPVSFILHVGSEAGSGDYLMALHGAF